MGRSSAPTSVAARDGLLGRVAPMRRAKPVRADGGPHKGNPVRRKIMVRMMRAAAIRRFGPPSEIRLVEKEIPTPAADGVVIRVEAPGVGSWDSAIRDGSLRSPRPTRVPPALGTHGAAKVAAPR